MADSGASGEPSHGVYCLGNDRVADWLGPFLVSLRRQEPSIPLYLIPFDDRMEETERLAQHYGAEIHDPPLLSKLDSIGRAVWPDREGNARMLRKFAVFDGPLERFLFLDSDVVVLDPVRPLIEGFAKVDRDFVYFDSDMDYVYRPGEFRERMERDWDARGFSAGSFLTTRSALDWGSVTTLAQEAADHRAEFPPGVGDQPVLNYLVDLGGLSKARAADVLPAVARSCWAGSGELEAVAGLRVRHENGGWAPFLHWAGARIGRKMPNAAIFRAFQAAHREAYGRSPLRATWRRFLPLR